MKKPNLTKYKNGVVIKWHNRRTTVHEINDKKGVAITFARKTEPGETEETTPCQSTIVRNRVRVTQIQLTRESAEFLFQALLHYLHK